MELRSVTTVFVPLLSQEAGPRGDPLVHDKGLFTIQGVLARQNSGNRAKRVAPLWRCARAAIGFGLPSAAALNAAPRAVVDTEIWMLDIRYGEPSRSWMRSMIVGMSRASVWRTMAVSTSR